MNVQLLIDAVVRQTMVLIAQLATSGGLRAPLAHVAGQAFLELAKELESQGVPKKVRADMFGMALRTYQRRTRRSSQSRTERGRSLWEAVLDYIDKGGVVTRDAVLGRFRYDDEASVRGVLRDLTESSLIFASGSGKSRVYRLASNEEIQVARKQDDRLGLEAHVWSCVYREHGVSLPRLAALSGLGSAELGELLESLIGAGRVSRELTSKGEVYRARELVLGLDDPVGWEASVLDHFSTVVQTILQKLAYDQKATFADEIGGSTYHLDLWRGHPLEEEVLGELRRFRERMSALRNRLDEYNTRQGAPENPLRVHAYYGQWLAEETSEDTEENGDD